MELAAFLFKTENHKKLAELLWVEGLTASVHELASLSGLPYATAYDVLHKMKKMGLVRSARKGKATLFSSALANEDFQLFKALMGVKLDRKKSLSDFEELDLPLVGEFPEFDRQDAQSNEELLVKTIVLAKKKSSLLRTLPLLVKKLV